MVKLPWMLIAPARTLVRVLTHSKIATASTPRA